MLLLLKVKGWATIKARARTTDAILSATLESCHVILASDERRDTVSFYVCYLVDLGYSKFQASRFLST
jgi:hypothetical protein